MRVKLDINVLFVPHTDINKGSPIEYKSGSSCSTPTKDTLKSYDRGYSGPVLPPRSAMCGAPSHHYSAPLNFRKGLVARCTWKCTAIAVILLSALLMCVLIFFASESDFTFLLLLLLSFAFRNLRARQTFGLCVTCELCAANTNASLQ